MVCNQFTNVEKTILFRGNIMRLQGLFLYKTYMTEDNP
jgi:hypothetical protein